MEQMLRGQNIPDGTGREADAVLADAGLDLRQRGSLLDLDRQLHAHWSLGRNLILAWCPCADGLLALVVPHYAVADGGAAGKAAGGSGDYAFVYLNVRMGRGRTEATQQRAGQILVEVAKAFFAPVMARRHIGITLQIDVGPEVFDAKHSNLHPLFNKV